MAEQKMEYFRKEFQFTGKHARMAGELWVLNDSKNSYFRRLIDLYILAPIIGFRLNRKAEADNSDGDTKSVFPEQILRERDKLEFIMQMILMLEYTDEKDYKSCVNLAFREPETIEEFQRYHKLFHDYVRGGVEELYERLVVRGSELDEVYKEEKSANIVALLERFGEIE